MLETPFRPRYKVRVNIRPVKYCYFIREDDIESLVRVLRLVCTQWGGIHNLIVPVKPDLSFAPLFQDLLELHEPDAFVSYLTDMKATDYEDHDQLQQYLRRLCPHRKVQLQIGDSFEKHDRTAHTLGTVLDEDTERNELIVHEFIGPQTDDWILLALFGAIYPGQQEDYAETVRLKEYRIGIDSDDFWESQSNNSSFGSVLNLTAYGVSPYKAVDHFESNHFDVVLVSSLNSLCMFWNLRATRDVVEFRKDMGRRTLLLPARLLDDAQALKSMVSFIRSRLAYPNISANLHLRFCVWDEADVKKIRAAAEKLEGLEEFAENKISASHTWNPDEPRRLEDFSRKTIKYRIMPPTFPTSYLEGVGYQVALSTELDYGRNEVLFYPPQGFRNRFGGSTALDIECDVWLRFLKEHRIAEVIKPNSWFSRYGVSLLAMTADRPHYIDFSLPSEWRTIELFFSARGYDIRLSKPGIYANALIELVDGLQNMDSLASKPAYLLLDTLALKSTKKLAQRITKELGLSDDTATEIQPLLEDMEIVPELKRIPKTYHQLVNGPLQTYRKTLLGLLTQLSEHQVIRRGFYLTCPNCGTPSWYPLQNIQESVTCSGCSYKFPLPVEYPEGSGGEIQWEYTLNTLVNRAMDQDVLPAVLALHHLTKDKQSCCIVPGLELLRSGDVKGEFDFIFVSDQQVFAGECKAGREIGDKDLKTARLAANLSIHHFYFCTVAEFSDASEQRIEELRHELATKNVRMDLTMLNGDTLLGEAIT
jgi:hypothetical protein